MYPIIFGNLMIHTNITGFNIQIVNRINWNNLEGYVGWAYYDLLTSCNILYRIEHRHHDKKQVEGSL